MAYLNSNQIKVYPSGYRGQNINYEAGVNSEENLNELASRLVANKSYVAEEYNDGTATKIKFVVDGYLFSTTKSAITDLFSDASLNTRIYAHVTTKDISVTANSITSSYRTLIPYNTTSIGILDGNSGDISGKFIGVFFNTAQGEDANALAVYVKLEEGWSVPIDSWLVFSSTQVQDSGSSAKEPISQKFHTQDAVVSNTLSVSGETSLSNSNIKLANLSSGTTADVPVLITSTGYLKKGDSTGTFGSTDDGTATFKYVDTFKQHADGSVYEVNAVTKTISANAGQGKFDVGTSTITLKDLTIADTPTFTNLKISSFGSDQGSGSNAVSVNNITGQLSSMSLSFYNPTAGTSTDATFTYVETIGQASYGQISATRKTKSISTGSSQGQITVGTTAINVKDLQTTSSPTFANITDSGLTASKLVISNANKKLASITPTSSAQGQITFGDTGSVDINNLGTSGTPTFSTVKLTTGLINSSGNSISLPSSAGTLAVISYDAGSATLTIRN